MPMAWMIGLGFRLYCKVWWFASDGSGSWLHDLEFGFLGGLGQCEPGF